MKNKLKTFGKFVVGVGSLLGIGFLVGVAVAVTHVASAEVQTVEVTKEVHVKDVRDFPPALQVICKAESGGKHLKADGHIVRGHINPSDLGICQINEPIWNDRARDLGYDIFSEQGNKDMALWLFDHYGTEPWNSSKAGWLNKLGK